MIQMCTVNQHLGSLVGKIPDQQVSGLDFESQTISCVLVFLILHLHPKQLTKKKNVSSSHRLEIWGFAWKRVRCWEATLVPPPIFYLPKIICKKLIYIYIYICTVISLRFNICYGSYNEGAMNFISFHLLQE